MDFYLKKEVEEEIFRLASVHRENDGLKLLEIAHTNDFCGN